MNTIVYNESERAFIEKSIYWGYDFDPETAEGTLAVRRFGKWSLMSASYDNGEVDSVLVYDGNVFYNWQTDDGETPAPVQAIQELSDRNSKFYRWFVEAYWPNSVAMDLADDLCAAVTGGDR